MKRLVMSLATASLLIIGTGCSTKNPTPEVVNVNLEFDGAPDWVMNTEGSVNIGVASAKITPAGLDFAETEATLLAKNKIARQVESKISGLTKNYVQTVGTGNDMTVEKVTSDVSRQLVNVVLTQSKITKKWISKTNTLWVQVKANNVDKQIENAEKAHKELIEQTKDKNDNI